MTVSQGQGHVGQGQIYRNCTLGHKQVYDVFCPSEGQSTPESHCSLYILSQGHTGQDQITNNSYLSVGLSGKTQGVGIEHPSRVLA